MNWKSNFQVLNFVSVSYERLSVVFLGVGLYILIGLYTKKQAVYSYCARSDLVL